MLQTRVNNIAKQEPDFIRPSDTRGSLNQRPQYDAAPQLQQFPQYVQQQQNGWMSHQSNQMAAQLPNYIGTEN